MSKADMEGRVCPVLLELTEPSSDDDYKIEAVAVSGFCAKLKKLLKLTLLLLKTCRPSIFSYSASCISCCNVNIMCCIFTLPAYVREVIVLQG